MKMFNYFKENDFFTVVFQILRCLLIFPPKDEKYKLISRIIFILYFTATVVLLTFLEIWYLIAQPAGFIEAVKCFGTLVYHAITLIRITHTLLNADTYVEIYTILKRKSFNFDNFDFTQLLYTEPTRRNDISNDAAPNYDNVKRSWKTKRVINVDVPNVYRKIQDKIMNDAKIQTYTYFVLILGPALISISFSYIACFLSAGEVYFDVIEGVEKIVREIPYNSMHLIDVTDPVKHLIALTHQGFTIYYLTIAFLRKLFFSIH